MSKAVMSKADTVSKDKFPRQGSYLHSRVSVSFDMEGGGTIGGEVVRDDIDRPYIGIIRLDDDRHVLMSECYYMPERKPTADMKSPLEPKEPFL